MNVFKFVIVYYQTQICKTPSSEIPKKTRFEEEDLTEIMYRVLHSQISNW
jgi:hypothetical protein